MVRRSTWPLGLVNESIGGIAEWMTPTLVLLLFTAPSSLTLPHGSAVCNGPEPTPLAGTLPSMMNGFCAAASGENGPINATATIARIAHVRAICAPSLEELLGDPARS